MRELFRTRRMWRPRTPLRERYDVVIVGGGAHGLATAYYLGQAGIKDVAVLERGYLGSGAAGRNTSILRANYATPEGARLYDESLKLYEGLAAELDYNVLFSPRGHLTLAHSERALATMVSRAEVNRVGGVRSRVVGAAEIKRLCPPLNISAEVEHPILGGLYHPPGGIVRHDAVVWGFARGADRAGVELHQGTEVEGLERAGDRLTAVRTNRGTIGVGTVICAAAGWSTLVCRQAGIELPVTTHTLQACVTEPVKPLLHPVVVSSHSHVYISQSDRGEFVIGADFDPWTSYRTQTSLRFLQDVSGHALALFPQLERARMLRAWAGLCDLTPDFSPILGPTEIENFHLSAGWGTYGFKAAPIAGRSLAELVQTGRPPELIVPFALERFYEDRLVPEQSAAATSR